MFFRNLSAATVEAPSARRRWLAAMRAGRSEKKGATSAMTRREARIGIAHALEILLARLLNEGKPHAQISSPPIATGTTSARIRAPWLPPTTRTRNRLSATPDRHGGRAATTSLTTDTQGVGELLRLGGQLRVVTKHFRERGGDGGRAARRNQLARRSRRWRRGSRSARRAPDRRHTRRESSGIAAEADDCRRLEPIRASPCRRRARRGAGSRHGDRWRRWRWR